MKRCHMIRMYANWVITESDIVIMKQSCYVRMYVCKEKPQSR